jgi:hypothetical protein
MSNTAASRDLANHVAIYANELSSQGMSKLALEQLYHERGDGLVALSQEQQRMVVAEREAIRTMIEDMTEPELTPEQQVQEYRDQGKHDEADNVQHTLNLNGLQAQLDSAATDLNALADKDDALSARRRDQLTTQVDELIEKMDSIPNAYEESVARSLARQEAALALIDSGDDSGYEMLNEARMDAPDDLGGNAA